MIFRKPYAFLIKNFKKIHIFLLVLSLFVAYKLLDVNKFVGDFMLYGSYDIFQDPISGHITIWLRIAILLIAIGSIALLFLLRHKQKPWKIYLLPIIEYVALFFVLGMISNFFSGYSSDVETTDLRLSKDLLTMFLIAQLPAIAVFVMRIFGLDIKKFNFNSDEEFLQLSEEDREEFEVNINIDHYSFKRFFKKTIRNFKYFYVEHKGICKGIGIFLIVFCIFQIYQFFFVTHKSYSEGNDYQVNGYTIQVHDSYFTDKDYTGNVITKNSNFVVVDLTVTNHDAPRKLNINNFHIKNGTSDFVSTHKTYAEQFQDFGTTYESIKELKRDESFRFIIVYKVDANLRKNQFNLFYQESNYLRKIKLDLKDCSKIEEAKKLSLGEDMVFSLRGKEEKISFDYGEFLTSVDYYSRKCNSANCAMQEQHWDAPGENIVLKVDFASTAFEGKDMVDFSNDYGKIVYIDNSNDENKSVEVAFHYPFPKQSTGKYLYTLLPREVENTSSLEFVYTIRNKKYIYKIV